MALSIAVATTKKNSLIGWTKDQQEQLPTVVWWRRL